MNNLLAVVIIGLYTIVYIIVFIIQKSQLDRMKEINSSMKTYMEIFKVDEVKKYVEMKAETTNLAAQKLIMDAPAVKKMVDTNMEKFKTEITKNLNIQSTEIIRFGIVILGNIPEDERIEIIDRYLPNSKESLMKHFERVESEI